MSFLHCLDIWLSLLWPLVFFSIFLSFSVCVMVNGAGSCVMESHSTIYCPCLSFWGLIWWGIKQLTYICYRHTRSVTAGESCLKPKRRQLRNVSLCQDDSLKRHGEKLSGYLSPSVCVSHTYYVKLSRHLLGTKTVGDLAGVAAAVLLPQVADGQPSQAPGPAGVWGQRPTIFQPAHGGARVAARYAGELDALAGVHLPGLETVQDGGRGLTWVWGKRFCYNYLWAKKGNKTKRK